MTTTWTWKTWKDSPFLTCSILPQPHGFFTQHFYPQVPADLSLVLAPDAKVYRVKQVHSGDVLTPTEIEAATATGLPHLPDGTPSAFPFADGIISESAQQSVWACSADCTPALIGDVATGRVSAVHAGWRGTAQKILPEAVDRFLVQGSRLEDLRVALGPAIDGEVYQVGQEVAAKVGATVISESGAAVDAIVNRLLAVENPPLLRDSQDGHVRLDVRRVNQMQLEQMGLMGEQIAIAPHCTYQEPHNFFSYRRTKEKKVQWSGIVSQ
ncbi:MAG: peptidoglycan editing factor PgeF [Cyanobacteria bacterium J06643_4]